uniref:Sin3 histone deacetylase corepressor complex component sds3 n=1 Tax=Anisakis simplex TaxID=6269 RepID=A0A0M3JS54_ANISI
LFRYYKTKIQELKAELQLLREFRHPKYLAAVQKLDAAYKEELEFEETSEKLENERIIAEYEREQEAADKELEERLAELMDTMIQECDENRKHIEHEFHNADINSASFYSYPVNKKSLRRRPNEPTPFSEKRMRAKNPQQVNYALSEVDILNDLRVLDGNYEDSEHRLDDHHKTGYNLRCET